MAQGAVAVLRPDAKTASKRGWVDSRKHACRLASLVACPARDKPGCTCGTCARVWPIRGGVDAMVLWGVRDPR